MRARRDALVYPGFFAATPWAQLTELAALPRRRSIAALAKSLKIRAAMPGTPADGRRDGGGAIDERVERNREAGRTEPALEAFRWLLEELQVSLFAQELKTPFPVSYQAAGEGLGGALDR